MSENPPAGLDEIHGSLTAPLLPPPGGSAVPEADAAPASIPLTEPTLPTLTWDATSTSVSASPDLTLAPPPAPAASAPVIAAAPVEMTPALAPPPAVALSAPAGQDPLAPVPAAPSLPSLPSLPSPATPAPPQQATVPAAAGQLSSAQLAAMANPGGTPTAGRVGPPRRSVGQSIGRTLVFALLLGAVGAGARFGYEQYTSGSDDAVEPASEGFGVLPPLGGGLPTRDLGVPDGRYTTIRVVSDSPIQIVDILASTDLQSDELSLDVSVAAPDGTTIGYTFANVDGQRLLSEDGRSNWIDTTNDPESDDLAGFSENAGTGFTYPVTYLLPKTAHPFLTIVAEEDTTLDLTPVAPEQYGIAPEVDATDADSGLLRDPVVEQEPAPVTPSDTIVIDADTTVITPVPVRRYQLRLDNDAFAAVDPLSARRWDDVLAGTGVQELTLWVDADGLVRKLETVDDEGDPLEVTVVTVTNEVPFWKTMVRGRVFDLTQVAD